MKHYLIDGQEFAMLPAYLEKDGFMRPVTSENFTIHEVEYDVDKHSLKSLKLKQAENAFLELVETVPGVQPGDNSDALTAKIEASNLTETAKLSLGMKLLNAIHEVEIQGGSWYDLPSVPHVI